jgi:hypothetical protein
VDEKKRPNWLTRSRFFVFVKIVVGDLFEFSAVWCALYLFHLLTTFLPVEGWAGRFIAAIHQIGSVAVVALLVIYLIVDVVKSRREK